jgi:hypothetical protein
MARDGMQELRERGRIEVSAPLLDHAQSEVDVPEQPSLLGRAEGRPSPELADPADVVQERGGEQQVVPEPRVQLRGLAAERRDPDRVLEQAAGIAVMAVGAGGGQRAERPSHLGVADERADHGRQALVSDLRSQELEESVELVRVPP